jgi:hypothetical protein
MIIQGKTNLWEISIKTLKRRPESAKAMLSPCPPVLLIVEAMFKLYVLSLKVRILNAPDLDPLNNVFYGLVPTKCVGR